MSNKVPRPNCNLIINVRTRSLQSTSCCSVQLLQLQFSRFLLHLASPWWLQKCLMTDFSPRLDIRQNSLVIIGPGVWTLSDRLFGPAASSSSPVPIMQHAPPPAGQSELLKESISRTCALHPPALMCDADIFAAAALLTDAVQPNICVASQLRSRRSRRPLTSLQHSDKTHNLHDTAVDFFMECVAAE